MKPRLITVFLLIVLVPLGLLGWLGVKVGRDEQKMVQHKFRELLTGKLRDIDERIVDFLEKREREFLIITERTSQSSEDLRGLVREQSFIRQVFVLDPEGNLLHPPLGGPLSEAEREFLSRTRKIWADKLLLSQAPQSAEAEGRLRAERKLPQYSRWQSPAQSRQVTTAHGWYVWYWEHGINLMFWRRAQSGRTMGIEVDCIRLLSGVIGELPDTDREGPGLEDGSIALVDSNGQVAYRWGVHDPPEGRAPQVELPLSYPLSSWRLNYYISGDYLDKALGRSVRFTQWVGLLGVGLALAWLATYFYRESSREMREASQRVSFVNQVSHELKTPLTNIRMYAELLEKDVAGEDDKTLGHLGVIVAESQRLSRLIGNVLTFGRKQRRKLTLRRTAGCVDDVITAALGHFQPLMEAKGVEITSSLSAPATVLFDADALEQILGNLFSNVEKYAASGKMMKVESRQEGEETVITVSDRGPGIPEREREQIFYPFYRLSDSVAEGVTGAGIGLAISRELAQLHGGALVLAPAPRGTCFKVTLHTLPASRG